MVNFKFKVNQMASTRAKRSESIRGRVRPRTRKCKGKTKARIISKQEGKRKVTRNKAILG